jgi:transposase
MGKAKKKYPKVKRIELDRTQSQAFFDRVQNRALVEEDYGIILAMAQTIQCITEALEEKTTSIKRLLKYLFGASTETAKKVIHKAESAATQAGAAESESSQKEKARPKGHGRNGAASYVGAERVAVKHPELKSGDPCPGCEKGKVYELALPSAVVRIMGTAPLRATVYELSRLRCNLCGMVFTAQAPDGAGESKFDDSATAMVALLKYGCGMPFNRLGKLQSHMGMPVPASTQWGLLDQGEKLVCPVFEALADQAAQGEILHNDDTTMKILSEIQNQDPDSTRKGIFTTGIVSIVDGRKIVLFMTGHHHAGENLEDVLQEREQGIPPPLQMCDGASRNIPKSLKTILANCLTHARRQFVDVVEAFPEPCAHVIELLAKVYHHDDLAREQGLTPRQRLAFHQEESGPVIVELKKWCEEQLAHKLVEPNSGLGKAINYMLKRWRELTQFLQIEGAPLDNNLCERVLKMAVLHRKNCYFYKTLHGAHVGDVFMSLIHTCQLSGENPFEYLTALLKNSAKVAKSPVDWLPWNYRATLACQR